MSIIERLFGSIQARLLAVLLGITLLTVVIVIAFNQWLRTQFIAGADSALMVNVSQIANRIDEFNQRNKQVFNVGTRLPDIIGYLQADEMVRSDPDFQERTRITLDSLDIEP
ncbi:MAG: hypothetical protein IT322_19640, partial [Anaerolineae bacterium]|nr:hypothetical protein [Anaerolineae bacterium]